MTRPYNPLRRDPRAVNLSQREVHSKNADAARFLGAVTARLGIGASANAKQILAEFDAQRAPSLAAKAGWAAPSADTPRPAAPEQSAIDALAAKAGWTGKA